MDFEKLDALMYHEKFMRYVWQNKDEPFLVGYHTKRICEEIDEALDRYRQGLSTFLLIKVPFRHGKSDLCPRYFTPRFEALFPNSNTMIVAYASSLAEKFSRFARGIVKSARYQELVSALPGKRRLSKEKSAINSWGLEGYLGMVNASGILSGITGDGYSLGILDDFCSGRADAESATIREKTWEAVSEDFLTRRAPVSITIVQATPWHVDDVIARIERKMKEDPKFPRFKVIAFPAKDEAYLELDRPIKSKYLFPERFSDEWYESQFATLGAYGSSGLLQCDPYIRSGGRLSTEGIVYEDEMPWDQELEWMRIWDLAHTAKQRSGADPDWTSGTRMAFTTPTKEDPIRHLYVANVKRMRLGASERDKVIKITAETDGYYVRQGIENTIDSKDAFEYIQRSIPEITWEKLEIKGDKAARATPLEAIFACPGHVHVKRGDWNEDWLDEIMRFDGRGKDHDDQVDNLSAGYQFLVNSSRLFSDKVQEDMAAMRR